ncbi:pali-domain-containing protein [Purpureocillium lavendulum]|uniref:Pali-domain-containing protein n=1 Tax=Purpureocillium lavendulum TaxID=1247861 RepID=A0AB34FV07_9HYPO|nr:pali-domain-containing protein [Purpureocillium lavendulum]
MGFGTFVHHIGTLLLLVATVLLIVVDITAPVVNNISILRVDLGPTVVGNEVTFGTFGYCHRGVRDGDLCSKARIGYNPAAIMSNIAGTDYSSAAENTSKGLTRVMVLHPVATGLCFIAFLLCLGTGICGALTATFFSLLSFVVTVVAMICDFVAFSIIKHEINDDDRARAYWGPGIWLMLVAAILTLAAAVIVFITCCAGRSKKRRQTTHAKEGFTEPAAGRRRFWQRRGRY